MDGSRTLARLVAEFARISGRLAPDQVRRIVADLAGNRMLEELPVDAFAPLQKVQRRPLAVATGPGPARVRPGPADGAGQCGPDRRPCSTRPAGGCCSPGPVAALFGTLAALGLVAFGYQWFTGEQSVFLSGDSYVAGAAVLLGLNVMALACHELGHALATKHAGRRVPAAGFLVYFGIPSVFVDTTDVWMSGRRGRLLTTAAGPAAGLVLAGTSALVGFAVPEAAPMVLQALLRLVHQRVVQPQPVPRAGRLLPGDGLAGDAQPAGPRAGLGGRPGSAAARRAWRQLDREGRLVALYGMLAIGWLVIALNIGYRVYVDRVGRAGHRAVALRLAGPLLLVVVVVGAAVAGRLHRLRVAGPALAAAVARVCASRRADRDLPRRVDALRALEPARPAGGEAGRRWPPPPAGSTRAPASSSSSPAPAQPEVYAVVDGRAGGPGPGRPGRHGARTGRRRRRGRPRARRCRARPSPLAWYTAGTTLLAMPASAVAAAVGPVADGGSFGTAAEAEACSPSRPRWPDCPMRTDSAWPRWRCRSRSRPGAPVSLSGPRRRARAARPATWSPRTGRNWAAAR